VNKSLKQAKNGEKKKNLGLSPHKQVLLPFYGE
jgi:hypothetical protein